MWLWSALPASLERTSGSAHHYLVVAMTQNARRLDAFGLDPASMPWTTQGSFYGPPPLLANLAMAHPCLLAARFLLSARPPDLLQFVCSMSQGRPPSRNRTRDDLDGPNPGSRPINVPDPTRAPGLLPIFLLLLSSRLNRVGLISGQSFSTTSCNFSVARIVSS